MINKTNFLLIALLVFAISTIVISDMPFNTPLNGAASGNVTLEVLPATPVATPSKEVPSEKEGGGGFDYNLKPTPSKQQIILSIAVLNSGKIAFAGDAVDVSISASGITDEVILTYGIAKDNEIAIHHKETINAQFSQNLIRKIKLPKYLLAGTYYTFVSATIDNVQYDATDSFAIMPIQTTPTAQFAFAAPNPLLAALVITGFGLGAFAVLAYKHIKRDKAIFNYLKKYREYYFKSEK